MAIIRITELEQAHENWCEFYHIIRQRAVPFYTPEFKLFVGIGDTPGEVTWTDRGETDNVNVSEQTAQYVRALTSPHWRTLLKVHLIRKEASNHG